MLSSQAIQEILGIKSKVHLTRDEMATHFTVTFFPNVKKASKAVLEFEARLKESLSRLHTNIVPYEEAWVRVPLLKRIKRFFKYSFNNVRYLIRRLFNTTNGEIYLPFATIMALCSSRRIKKNVNIICLGEQDVVNLQMQHISSFKDNSIITIVDFPSNINELSTFESHFDTAMNMFAYHMTNIVIGVDFNKMILYNFNASHPVYTFSDGKFDDHIKDALIPKIVAPISPHKFSEFIVLEQRFDPNDYVHDRVIKNIQEGANILSKTNLYPNGKKIDDLPFRHSLHRLIGKLHLDNRSGMSYGFLAHQMPTPVTDFIPQEEFIKNNNNAFKDKDYYYDELNNLYILLQIAGKQLVMKIPEVWVMTLRSGSNKTGFNPNKDTIKLGLKNGKMLMQFPKELKISPDNKPSFDTKVILAHAVGNSIVSSVSSYLSINPNFVNNLSSNGVAMSHWHGYFNSKFIPSGVISYGGENPHVSCSSPQSAIFALGGKLETFQQYYETNKMLEYRGDIHIEPHHGINVIYPSLKELAEFIVNNPDATSLGNKYLIKK